MAAIRAAILNTGNTSSLFGNDHQSNTNILSSLTDVSNVRQANSKNQQISLALSDRNGKMRAPSKAPLAKNSANRKMTHYDKHSSSKPLAPTLTASAKSNARPPLTPRLVSSRTTCSTRQASLPVSVTSRPRDGKIAPPVSEFINNVVPRSGSRISRVNSTNSSPSTSSSPSLPNLACISGFVPSTSSHGELSYEFPRKSSVSFVPSAHSRTPYNWNESQKDAKFFFANELKTATSQQRPHIQTKNATTYSYANHDMKTTQREYSNLSPVSPLVSEERSHPLFFHANGKPEHYSHSVDFVSSQSCTSSKGQTQVITTKLGGSQSPTSSLPALHTRSNSPVKLNQHVSPPPLEPAERSPRLAISTKGYHVNKITAGETIKNSNLESPEAGLARPSTHDQTDAESCYEDTDCTKTAEFSNKSQNTPLTTYSDPELVTEAIHLKELQSPIRMGRTEEEKNDPAKNARRERKILDLEITNSSLAAINRTLERKMKKQTIEIRRFQRLSRTGFFTLNQTGSVDALLEGEAEGTNNQVISPNFSENEDIGSDQPASDNEYKTSDGEISKVNCENSEDVALSDLRYRTNDEKRLQHDLARHQQVLTGSQKMNQTLKRCLGLTEEMIGEGLKALQHTVTAGDLELGGRVLEQDDMEGNESEGMSEVSLKIPKEARESTDREEA